MRAVHRAASVGELGMKDLLYAADTTSSWRGRALEFMFVCLYVQSACDCSVCCESHDISVRARRRIQLNFEIYFIFFAFR